MRRGPARHGRAARPEANTGAAGDCARCGQAPVCRARARGASPRRGRLPGSCLRICGFVTTVDGAAQVLDQGVERCVQGRPPGHQHHVGGTRRQVAAAAWTTAAQAPPDAVALRRVADPLGDGEADAQAVARIAGGSSVGAAARTGPAPTGVSLWKRRPPAAARNSARRVSRPTVDVGRSIMAASERRSGSCGPRSSSSPDAPPRRRRRPLRPRASCGRGRDGPR